ncbi:general transcription factor 3C polypeptide 2 [Thrips palmi]|uniref:General transcription factor 3C polypeptide 2 n=1 Tax=Thrips palmi TaxID=161013 RepID=A0A6P8ZPJ5_THRPL|nr:general transcription factor 3C polypeptide 2 [Thrips palmi]XP_034244213.1 general transcription factor 3C polypeptide 2 [Thrips palmi]XP_034244214.1 general transcription factor 3C polypeptide 2 [Thrips palmi]
MDLRGHSVVKHEVEADADVVQCAVCKVEMAEVDFIGHNAEMHNMLSWIEGTNPLDLNNEKFVLSILNKVLKGKKRKVLSCELCGEEKKSAVGFYTHKQVCGKSEEEIESLRITCEICGKSFMPVSLRSHMLIHQRKEESEISLANCLASPTTPGSSSGKKNRRAAATKAKSRMSVFLSGDGSAINSKQTRLYSDMEVKGWDSAPRLLQTWRGFISLAGSIVCVYNGCPFRADSIDSIQTHISSCEFMEDHDMKFICNVCLVQQRDESEIISHIQLEHDSQGSCTSAEVDSVSDRDSTSDVELETPHPPMKRQNNQRQTPKPKPSGPQRAFTKMRFLQNTVTGLGKDLDIYPAALKWTFDFRMTNYVENIFPNLCLLKKECKFLGEGAENYIPSTSQSLPIEFGSSLHGISEPPHNFTLFEGQIIDGVSTFFTGGPVWSLEWCPIPMQICLSDDTPPSEYLAVSTHHKMDDTFCVPQCYSFPNVIQIWDCGNLSSSSSYQSPKFSLGIGHNYGTVWSMAWCPSGAYDYETKFSQNDNEYYRRMGLLAAACSNGNVYVLSIPFPDELKSHEQDEALPIYQCKPSLTLTTNFTEPSQCTRVTWYQGQGHGLIAAGYCNGMVAIWDLLTLPPLLWDPQQRTLKPFQCFQAHLTVVSALSFNPEYDGRFFMTGSHDRGVKFWDMEDLSAPMTHHRRGYVTDGVWLNLWISSITSYDDAFQHEHTNSTLHPVRDFGYKPYPLLTQNSVAWCLSYNEWINATAQGSEAGEIVVTFSGQLMRGLDNEKNAIDKRLMATYTLLKKRTYGDDGETELGEVVQWKPESKQANKGKGKGKKANNSKGKGKSKKGQEEDGEEVVAASLYTPEAILQDRNPQFYADIEKNYGLCVYDTMRSDSNKNKVPDEAKSRVRISGKMHPTCSDYYPITSINKVAWNPNIGRFFYLATGHQCGIVRITGMHFMQNAATNKFLVDAAETMFDN